MLEGVAAKVSAVLASMSEVRVAWLFGSTVVGNERADSDLDLALAFAPELDDADKRRVQLLLVDHLTEALGPLGERTDLVDLDEAAAGVAFKAIQGACVLSRDDRERRLLEVRIARRYDDEAPIRALYRRAAQRRWGLR